MTLVKQDVINAEMLTHVALCTHREPKDILVLADKDIFENETNRHEGLHVEFVNESETSFVEACEDDSCDVVIVDNASLNSAIFCAQISRILREDGLVVFKAGEDIKDEMSNLGSLFGVVMAYQYDGAKAIIASKKYHPTADIILQRADLIDGLEYYNVEIHLGAFALPTRMRKDLLGIQKN